MCPDLCTSTNKLSAGQIQLDDYYINPSNKHLDYSNNIVYKDVLGVPRNEEVQM